MSTSARETVPRLNWSTISRLIRLPSQTGTWLLMLPALWALVLSSRGIPPWRLLVIFMLGSFVMRSETSLSLILWKSTRSLMTWHGRYASFNRNCS